MRWPLWKGVAPQAHVHPRGPLRELPAGVRQGPGPISVPSRERDRAPRRNWKPSRAKCRATGAEARVRRVWRHDRGERFGPRDQAVLRHLRAVRENPRRRGQAEEVRRTSSGTRPDSVGADAGHPCGRRRKHRGAPARARRRRRQTDRRGDDEIARELAQSRSRGALPIAAVIVPAPRRPALGALTRSAAIRTRPRAPW